MATPEGWYPHPSVEGMERYWDGQMWTQDVRPIPPPKPRPFLSTVAGRLAAAAAVLFLLAALALSLVPTSSGPVAHCGWWFHQNWPRDAAAEADKLDEIADQLDSLGGGEEADKAHGQAAAARVGFALCSGPLSTRRTWSFVSLGLAIAVPITIVFVAGRKPTTT